MSRIIHADVADQFLDDRDFKSEKGLRLRFWLGDFWYWDGKKYQKVPNNLMSAMICEYLRENGATRPFARPSHGNAIKHNLQAVCLVPNDFEQPGWLDDRAKEPMNFISLANGILDVDTYLKGKEDVLLPHDPNFFSGVCLPYRYDKDAGCPLFMKFFEEVVPDKECRQFLKEWAGYCLIPDTKQQNFVMLIGTGRNGKSVFCDMLILLLGRENVSSVPLEAFSGRFSLSGTIGKLANIVSEVGQVGRTSESILKAFTGGDQMQFEKKFKDGFDARPTARLMVATNRRPKIDDRTDGIWRRMIEIPFPIQISKDKQDRNLVKKLEAELPGILNWALDGLNSLSERDCFIEPVVSIESKKDYRKEMNPAMLFFDHECVFSSNADISVDNLYQAYRIWCRRNGHSPLNSALLGKELKRICPDIEKRQRRVGRSRVRYYKGVNLKGEIAELSEGYDDSGDEPSFIPPNEVKCKEEKVV